MEEEKLIDYVRGGIKSEDEILEVLDWIQSSEENQKKYNSIKNLWVLTGLNGEYNYGVALRKGKTLHSKKSRKLVLMTLRYAAVFIFAFFLGTGSFYLIKQNQTEKYCDIYNEIYVPRGERSIVYLYDGTKVWLNSETYFKYPVHFNKKERNVFIKGEAFFDVKKDKTKPFNVIANRIKVEVLGTDLISVHILKITTTWSL